MEGERPADLLLEDEFVATSAPAISLLDRLRLGRVRSKRDLRTALSGPLGDLERISTGGGRVPRWAPDGAELFYQSLDGHQLFAVPIDAESTLTAGTPEVLFEGAYLAPQAANRPSDLTPDGKTLRDSQDCATSETDDLPHLVLVLTWFEELKRLVVPVN